MEAYREAYECYKAACEDFGMESINFNHFVRHLTTEQLNEYGKNSN